MSHSRKIASTSLQHRLLALSLALLFPIGTVWAQETTELTSYDVELVIFRQLSPTATPEQWDEELAAAGHQPKIDDDEGEMPQRAPESAPEASLTRFPALPPAKFKLNAIEESLRRSRDYRPLAHIGWTQPGFPIGSASFVSVAPMVPAGSGLSGQVALSAGRYLHLTLDLVLDGPAAVAGGPAQRFVLRQSRRMRSNERHYIDHPEFGVIAVVTPSAP